MILGAFHDSVFGGEASAGDGPTPCPAIRMDLCHIRPLVVRLLADPLEPFDSTGVDLDTMP